MESPVFMGVSRGEEFLDTLHPLFTTLHLSWFGGGCVIILGFLAMGYGEGAFFFIVDDYKSFSMKS